MSTRPPTSLPEETLERVIEYVDGPMNRRAERLLKSRLLLVPAAVCLTVTFRSLVALRDRDPRALLGRRRNKNGGAR